MAIDTSTSVDVQTLTPFKKFIMTIGALPTSYLESMTYAELLMWFCNYLQETVIPTVNNNAEAVEELQELYEELKSYVNNYFDNLDVQNEINKKLDEMAKDGTLTNLISTYVDPLLDAYEEHIENRIDEQDTNIATISAKVDTAVSGSPLTASSTDDMTETDRVYVNTTNGYWYYYDGDSWEQGGIYLSTDENDKIDDLVDITLSWTEGYYINSLGVLTSNASYKYCDYIPLFYGGVQYPIKIKASVFKNTYAGAYDKNQNLIETIKLSNSDSLENIEKIIYNKDYYYIRFTTSKNYSDAGAYYTDIHHTLLKDISNEMILYNTINKDNVNFIVSDENKNLIDFNNLTEGYINNNGNISTTNNLYVSNFFNVNHNKTYKHNALVKQYYAFYDVNKNFISGQSTLGNLPDNEFTPPENANFMRVTIHTNQLATAYVSLNSDPLKYQNKLENDILPNTYCDYNGKEILTFNKILCIGDSLTKGVFNIDSGIPGTNAYITDEKYSYPTILHKYTGVEVTNAGDSGKSIETWYSLHQNDDLSGHDCCIIALGTNNQTWGQEQITAMTNIINKVKNENNNIFVFVSSIIPARSYQHTWYEDINYGLKTLVEALNDDHVIYIDLTNHGHTNDSLCYNAGHLSAYGYNRLAQDYANYISFIMMCHPSLFRKIQFIGTDYDYTS